MASFRQAPRYCYSNDQHSISEEAELSGILDIFVHHARNIHNICIYDNQDVYAKFSLTYNPDDTISTRIINGGGKNPDFNDNLAMKVTQMDAVLKCEIWMLSRARSLLEDQLLGFALVPISMVAGKDKITEDFSLSSTDLFHSPAGTVKLSLSLNTCLPLNSSSKQYSHVSGKSSITSEVVFLDRNTAESVVDPVEYSRIEFPDINMVHQNQQMVSEYFSLASRPNMIGEGSFLHLGATLDDSEMTLNSSEENLDDSASPSGSIQTSSGLLSSTTTNLSDDNRNTADSIEQRIRVAAELCKAVDSITSAKTLTSDSNPSDLRHASELNSSAIEQESKEKANSAEFCRGFSAPLQKMNLEAEQSAMQQQIVDMYMKSMHQFTESLAKMKLPMDLDKPETEDPKNTMPSQRSNSTLEVEKKKDGSRVFYGSRAFF